MSLASKRLRTISRTATMNRFGPRKLHGGLLLSVFLATLSTGVAFAHLDLARSIPADGDILQSPPPLVQLWFNEELDTYESEVSVFDSSGKKVDLSNSNVNPDDRTELRVGVPETLSHDAYTVVWIAVDDNDGHPISGEIGFSIKAKSQPFSQRAVSGPALFLMILSFIGSVILLVVIIRQRRREQ